MGSARFNYRPPRPGFNRGAQPLLLTALASFHRTDQELSGALHHSLPTIKKTWGSIYRRVADCDPNGVPDLMLAASETYERGREKRRSLLGYVREHPEELRPHCHKLGGKTCIR